MKLKKEENVKSPERRKLFTVIGVVATVVVVLTVIAFTTMHRDFDAQGYVRATLDQYFQGSVEEIAEFVTENSKSDHYELYEEQIEEFVENNITSDIEISEELEQKYTNLCKEIFRTMKYDVKPAKKESGSVYKVEVEYQASDVFLRFVENLKTEHQRLLAKAQNAEYTETKEENILQMENEFLTNSYELLKTAHQEMEYGEKQTFTFEVKRGEKGLFCMEEMAVSDFIIKILRLDEIQD